jgi:predicted nucleotide-binding protein
MSDSPQAEERSILEYLRERLTLAETLVRRPEVHLGQLALWSTNVRSQLEKIYGKDSPLLSGLPVRGMDRSIRDPRAELTTRIEQMRRILEALEAAPRVADTPLLGRKIFIGHGRSLVWLQLKDFIRERLRLPCDEFNIEPVAGISTTARLETMLAQAGFAFVVMTAEEEHADGRIYARPNVIHESGLFQGKLGSPRAIVILEEGCSDFSNISGLTQIRFPPGDLKPALEDVRRVLEREGHI